MKNAIKRFGALVLDTVYPRVCPVCRDVVTPKGALICPECRSRLPYVAEPTCMDCGKPIASEQNEFCRDCEQKKHSFEKGFAVFVYDDVMQQAVGDYKYRNQKELAEFFAAEMAVYFQKRMTALNVEALIPVPIHATRKRYRGYNQTEILCRMLSEQLGIPVLDCMERNKKTAPQKTLDAADRLQNLESAIRLKKEVVQKQKVPHTVVLVDDIYTTGSTAEACARVLLRGGVRKVYIFSLCIGTEQ